jgi:REP element-mobilizing transposase RayT
LEAKRFVEWMRKVEAFCGVRVLTWTLMSNHFHLLLQEAESGWKERVADSELIERVRALNGDRAATGLAKRWTALEAVEEGEKKEKEKDGLRLKVQKADEK